MVVFETNKGNFTLELFPEKAPKTVENFLNYVRKGFYDNTIFHRVIPNFMIQGGGFEPGMSQKATDEQIENEADNGLSNETGTVAMARTGDPHSASCQFFINVKDNNFLDFQNESPQGYGYCVFAKVVDGMDVIEKIRDVETSSSGMHQDVPVDDVIINKAYESKD
ncbi:MAG TPA: peptidyl-prolyl cis-trans isomerase [Aeromonadales bacterium]|nr:peptidyl-prolyl cis-trans isomerase [Aeromonadales bacterium]